MHHRVSAVFESDSQAEQAVSALRNQGVADDAISVVAKRREDTTHPERVTSSHDVHEDTREDTPGDRAGKGAMAGAGVGALFGLAASLIPGVGPFITAGWLAGLLGAVGGGIASGAIVGGTAGAVAGALSKAGYERHEADYYGKAIEEGKYFVTVDSEKTRLSPDAIRDIFSRFGGHFAPLYGDKAA